MKIIQGDRLFINDSDIPDTDISDCLGSDASYYNIELVNGYSLGESFSEKLLTLSQKVDRILLPGYSSAILLRCTDLVLPKEKVLFLPSVRRKLEGMTPRGINISDDDALQLAQCDPREDILLLDDVVASGTTANGIAKRIKKTDIRVATLAYREPNELKIGIKQNLISSCQLIPKTVRFPAMNTLSSLRNKNKADGIVSGFAKLYGEKFALRIQELFNIS